jgi:hypothetical protein
MRAATLIPHQRDAISRAPRVSMTANRDLKRRVRDRQSSTAESYLTALRPVLARRPGGIPSVIPTVEFIEVSGVATRLGLKCRLTVSPGLGFHPPRHGRFSTHDT